MMFESAVIVGRNVVDNALRDLSGVGASVGQVSRNFVDPPAGGAGSLVITRDIDEME